MNSDIRWKQRFDNAFDRLHELFLIRRMEP